VLESQIPALNPSKYMVTAKNKEAIATGLKLCWSINKGVETIIARELRIKYIKELRRRSVSEKIF